jgi:thioredoxin-dependent peroxiredoxin
MSLDSRSWEKVERSTLRTEPMVKTYVYNYRMLKKGQKAPKFRLKDQNDEEHTLSDYLGKWVLLYFYPKDDTPGCTKEACGIRDNFAEYKKAGITVLGVSKDSVKSHKKFEKKYELPFTLLSDENKDVLKKYGVWQKKKMMGKEYMGTVRISFLINPEGKITKIYPKVKPEIHAKEVLADTKNLSNN